MGKPILYGYITNPPVRTCLLTAAAIDLDFEFREVNLFKQQHLTSEYLKKNPQHTIPTLEIDGKFLCDSHAIIAYLVEKYAKDDSLYPKDLFQRGLVDQRLYFDSGILFPRLRAICPKVLNKEISTISKNLKDPIYEAYDFLEKFLNETDYVATNNITIADFACIATISFLTFVAPLSTEKYPNILAWIKRMESLPYYEEKCGKGAKLFHEYFQKALTESQNSVSKYF